MSVIIPTTFSRVPTTLGSHLALSNMNRVNAELLRVQSQIATGRDLLRPSDDVVRAAGIGVLDDRLERSQQLIRNLSHASASLGVLDTALGEAAEMPQQARSIASEQINLTSSAAERAGQVTVVDQILAGLFNTANRESVAGFIFGGSQTTRQPVEQFLGGYRFRGDGPGLTTDLGTASRVPITLGAGNPLAAISGRIRSTVDYNPSLTADTRLSDLNGARGLGVTAGVMEVAINGGGRATVDLTGADTVGDVTRRIESAIRGLEASQGVTVLGPGGVSMAGGSLDLDLSASAVGTSVEFFDISTGSVAKDLGLTDTTPFLLTPGAHTGADLDPKLTWRSPINTLAGINGALGQIRIKNAGRSVVVDLSNAQTLQDVKNLIEGANLGVRVAINPDGSGLDIHNEVAAGSDRALSIEEVGGQSLTATRMGIRSFSGETRIADFNHGRGVKIVDGVTDPVTGGVSATGNIDFEISLGDAAGTLITIDLRPQDMGTVQSVVDRINDEIQTQLAAAGLPANSLQAGLSDSGNGIVLVRDPSLPNPTQVGARNNSAAAEHLGLLGGSWDAASATFAGEDRATVRVESIFNHLLDLRAALAGNDTRGIGLAGTDLEAMANELTEHRGLVGAFAQRVETAATREEDRAIFDEQVRSELRDLDYTSAATRFSLLQTQLEAGLRATALARQQSLLDFLG